MRRLLFLLSLAALGASAQDVIVKKDGTPILTKVLKVNSLSEGNLNRCNNPLASRPRGRNRLHNEAGTDSPEPV